VLSFQEDAIGIRLRDVIGLYSEVNFFTPGAANLIGVGPAVFLFRYYTAVRCTVSVACVA
jgi:hypothetical protein